VRVDIDDRLGKVPRCFLRQIVPDTARDEAVFIAAREFPGIGTGLWMRCPIGIAFQRNRGHADVRSFSEPLFQLIIFRLAFSQPEPPAVIVDHDADMIRVVEGRGAAREGGLVEVPFRRSDLPDELCKVAPVSLVAGPASICFSELKDVLVPFLIIRVTFLRRRCARNVLCYKDEVTQESLEPHNVPQTLQSARTRRRRIQHFSL
jgi:hypothetical protein